MTSDTTLLCVICGETAEDEKLVSECMGCSRVFHLNPYSSGDHKDCGDALIGPTQGVEFWCQICIDELNADLTQNPPDPRAMLDQLAAPGGALVMSDRTPSTGTPAPSETASNPSSATRTGSSAPPPARRGRTQPRKRYRRIDG